MIVFAPRGKDTHSIDSEFFHIPIHSSSMNPIVDILLVIRILLLMKRTKPDVVLNFTIKPVIYGTICAKLLGIPCVNNITGLGALFQKRAALQSIGFLLYYIVMRFTNIAFFQNPDDLQLFSRMGLLRRTKVDILPGSGVDLKRFMPEVKVQKRNEHIVFLFVGRLLLEKGIGDFIDAARIVKTMWEQARFQVVGPFSHTDKNSELKAKIMLAIKDGTIIYSGSVKDVRPYIAEADCVVLPSYYREGTPRSLLEAAAMEKPIITTDMPGCRDVVENGKNGLYCKVKDPKDLAKQMIEIIQAPINERMRMGSRGRYKMEREFDESIVIRRYLSVIKEVSER